LGVEAPGWKGAKMQEYSGGCFDDEKCGKKGEKQ